MTSREEFEEKLRHTRQRYYNALRQHNQERFYKCIASAESVTLTHDLTPKAAVAVEWAVIASVCDALGITPHG